MPALPRMTHPLRLFRRLLAAAADGVLPYLGVIPVGPKKKQGSPRFAS